MALINPPLKVVSNRIPHNLFHLAKINLARQGIFDNFD